MAGAIAEIARQTLAADFRRIDPRTARIVLIEAGPRLLPAFPPEQSDYVRTTLMRAGVTVMTDTMVTKCDARGVNLNSGRLDAGTVIWAAGVTASPAAQWLSAEADRAGRVKVERDLSMPGHPEIFVIGDAAAVIDSKGRPVPGIASAAKQMGRYVGKLIAARIAGRSGPAPFRYMHLGELATIGRRAAVVKFGRLRVERIHRLAVLERRPHLFPDRPAQSLHRRLQLALELSYVPARRPADHQRADKR